MFKRKKRLKIHIMWDSPTAIINTSQMVKSSSKSLLVKSSSKGLFLAHKTVCGRFILRRKTIAWCFEVYFMLCAKPHSSFRIQPVIFIHIDRPQSPKARKAQEWICVPRKKKKWDLVNSIISATDWFWSNYFPPIYIYIYIFLLYIPLFLFVFGFFFFFFLLYIPDLNLFSTLYPWPWTVLKPQVS